MFGLRTLAVASSSSARLALSSAPSVARLALPFPSATSVRCFHRSMSVHGWEEFTEPKKANEVTMTGRGWTAADLRRKSFEDLHRLWFLLYKERNLLLSEKDKLRRNRRPVTTYDEKRYYKVKKGMAAIRLVVAERRKIGQLIESEAAAKATADAAKDDSAIKKLA
jgi:hypothetical protein